MSFDTGAWSTLINNFNKVRVLCLGDCMLDRFIYGTVKRISPEGPIPVFQQLEVVESLGGAANVAQNLAHMDITVDFLTVVGGDASHMRLQNLLKKLPKIRSKLIVDNNRPTTQKTRYVVGTQQLLRVDEEQIHAIDNDCMQQFQQFITENMDRYDVILLSDYRKGVLRADLIEWIISMARSRQKTVLIDPKGRNYQSYAGATVMTPNVEELAQASSMPVSTDAEIIMAARHIMHQFNIASMVVTRGADGVSIIDFQTAEHIPAQAQSVIDVSGAGDTFIATLAGCLAQNVPLDISTELANKAAGLVVGKRGTAYVTSEELQQMVDTHSDQTSFLNLLDFEQMDTWRAHGLKIGLTNGCFDILHAGHIELLSYARQNCDRLIVAVNSDASVKRLKGSTRPIHTQDVRLQMLSALKSVDLAVIFDEDTPLQLIQKIRPDVLIKGSDYTVEQVVGAKEVKGWGGCVLLADLKPGFSTTNIIQGLQSLC